MKPSRSTAPTYCVRLPWLVEPTKWKDTVPVPAGGAVHSKSSKMMLALSQRSLVCVTAFVAFAPQAVAYCVYGARTTNEPAGLSKGLPGSPATDCSRKPG